VVLSSLAGQALGLLAAPPAGGAAASPGGEPGADATRPARMSSTKNEQRRLSW